MDYANESYVRLYVRDTTTWKLLSWEARAVLCLLLRKVDRSGALEVGEDGVAGVAAHIEVPIDVAERAIQQLVNPKRPVLVWDGHSFAFPNFLEAQETPSSDKQRAKESRANRRTKIVNQSRNVTPQSQDVTHPSHAVTDGHTASHPVTLSVLSLSALNADLSGVVPPPAQPALELVADSAAIDPALELARACCESLHRLTGREFRPDSEASLEQARKLAKRRVKPDQVRLVVEHKCRGWVRDPKMAEYLVPKTLMRPSNFFAYLDDMNAGHVDTQTPIAHFATD